MASAHKNGGGSLNSLFSSTESAPTRSRLCGVATNITRMTSPGPSTGGGTTIRSRAMQVMKQGSVYASSVPDVAVPRRPAGPKSFTDAVIAGASNPIGGSLTALSAARHLGAPRAGAGEAPRAGGGDAAGGAGKGEPAWMGREKPATTKTASNSNAHRDFDDVDDDLFDEKTMKKAPRAAGAVPSDVISVEDDDSAKTVVAPRAAAASGNRQQDIVGFTFLFDPHTGRLVGLKDAEILVSPSQFAVRHNGPLPRDQIPTLCSDILAGPSSSLNTKRACITHIPLAQINKLIVCKGSVLLDVKKPVSTLMQLLGKDAVAVEASEPDPKLLGKLMLVGRKREVPWRHMDLGPVEVVVQPPANSDFEIGVPKGYGLMKAFRQLDGYIKERNADAIQMKDRHAESVKQAGKKRSSSPIRVDSGLSHSKQSPRQLDAAARGPINTRSAYFPAHSTVDPDRVMFVYPNVAELSRVLERTDPSFIPTPAQAEQQGGSDSDDFEPELVTADDISEKQVTATPTPASAPQRASTRIRTVVFTAGDLAHLDSGEFLNDSCIDWWYEYVHWRTANHPSFRKRLHIFSSFFYKKLTQGKKAPKHSADEDVGHVAWRQVSRWTRDVDLFTKKFIFIPINQSLHWSLAIVCNADALDGLLRHQSGDPSGSEHGEESERSRKESSRPCIVFLDSLKCHNQAKVCEEIREYLYYEWVSRKNNGEPLGSVTDAKKAIPRKAMPDFSPNVPQQNNSCDCGVYICMYAHGWVTKWQNGEFCPTADSMAVPGLGREAIESKLKGIITQQWFSPRDAKVFRNNMKEFARLLDGDEKALAQVSRPRLDGFSGHEKRFFQINSWIRPTSIVYPVSPMRVPSRSSSEDESAAARKRPQESAGAPSAVAETQESAVDSEAVYNMATLPVDTTQPPSSQRTDVASDSNQTPIAPHAPGAPLVPLQLDEFGEDGLTHSVTAKRPRDISINSEDAKEPVAKVARLAESDDAASAARSGTPKFSETSDAATESAHSDSSAEKSVPDEKASVLPSEKKKKKLKREHIDGDAP